MFPSFAPIDPEAFTLGAQAVRLLALPPDPLDAPSRVATRIIYQRFLRLLFLDNPTKHRTPETHDRPN